MKVIATMIDGKKHLIGFSTMETIIEVRNWLNAEDKDGVVMADYLSIGKHLIINRHHIIRLQTYHPKWYVRFMIWRPK